MSDLEGMGARVDLLLVSAQWPHGPVPEFLDPEVRALASVFREVRVAPLRPRGAVIGTVPQGVRVDYSLSESLAGKGGRQASRYARGLLSVVRPSGVGLGAPTRHELAAGLQSPSWAKAALMSRADLISVMLWARRSPRPALAYTFWLGPETVGLRKAWPRTPIVSRAHGGDLYCEAHRWTSIPFQADAVRSVDLLATVSQNGHDYLVDKYASAKASIEVHRLGFDDIGGLAENPSGRPIRMLSVSSIDENKRVDRIARAAIWLARSGMPVHWTHLGDGPARAQVDGVLAAHPTRLTVDLPGQVSHDKVVSEMLHGRYSVLVNLSLSEGAPVSLMEAQCVGMPVVATRVGASAEVAPSRWNQLIEVDADVPAIATAIVAAAQSSGTDAENRRRHWLQNSEASRVYPQFAKRLAQLAYGGPRQSYT